MINGENTEKMSVFSAVSLGFFPASVPFSLLSCTTIQENFSVLAPLEKFPYNSLGYLHLCPFPL